MGILALIAIPLASMISQADPLPSHDQRLDVVRHALMIAQNSPTLDPGERRFSEEQNQEMCRDITMISALVDLIYSPESYSPEAQLIRDAWNLATSVSSACTNDHIQGVDLRAQIDKVKILLERIESYILKSD